jgi:hypothetical protein
MVRTTLRGIRRTIGAAAIRKAPLTADLVRAMMEATPDNLIGLRDRAAVDRVRWRAAALSLGSMPAHIAGARNLLLFVRLRIRASKTDQRELGLQQGRFTRCPVAGPCAKSEKL